MNGAPYFNNAGIFLIQTAFGFYILALLLRFLLQWVRADFYNPLVQFLVRVTNPPLIPLRRSIPGLFGLDLACLLLMLALQIIEWLLVLNLGGLPSNPFGVLVLALAELLGLTLQVFLWAVIIQALMSWFVRDPRNPLYGVLYRLTAPVLRPVQRVLPLFGGVDLSPLIALVVLQLMHMLLIAPIRDLGFALLRS
ncbi:YggT family protein [Plasticicumulans acidivorans]|uniref:YggT family protein n=1 Tax=Plasticicumulans acidivorans TaxID=886464 RepID=A0A317MVD5_9GAMM|nr:YggT family protein [Plasticicumulans acidivorans]PWV62305.1 YggT family protein [Plasticicumulans acidivorans]